MNTVQPIRDEEKIDEIQMILLEKSYRDFLMFTIGIYSGLRVSDILKLQVKDVENKTHISIREKKTAKEKEFLINRELRAFIDYYIKGMDSEDYLIVSRKGENKPIVRQTAYNLIKKAGEKAGVANLGTHTMRKTYGYHFYRKTKNVALLMTIFNHSSEAITLKYIGVTQDEMDKKNKGFRIGKSKALLELIEREREVTQ